MIRHSRHSDKVPERVRTLFVQKTRRDDATAALLARAEQHGIHRDFVTRHQLERLAGAGHKSVGAVDLVRKLLGRLVPVAVPDGPYSPKQFPRLKLLAVLLASLGLATPSALAAVQARVEPMLVDEMEPVRLTLRVDGLADNQTDTDLDLSELEEDFELLGTNTSSQFQIINGRTTSWMEYQISLRPKRTGTLTIPAIAVMGERSQPLQITVRPLAPEVRDAIDRMVFFEVEVTPNPVYVQAQAMLTRRLFYSGGVQIYSDLPGAPDLPNAVVIAVGDTRSTTAVRPEGRYGVLEQHYAIFPEQSGTLTIPEISVTSSVRSPGGGTRRSGIRVSAPEIRLEVLPVPAAYPADQPWLPAKQVSISDVWEPAALAFDIGEPVRRTLTVEVVGNTGSAIAPLAPGLPANIFKQYPEPVAIGEEAVAMDVVGTRQQPYSIIPVAAGAEQLPGVALTWWDTVNEQVRIASVAGERVRIVGEAPAQALPPVAGAPADGQTPAGAPPPSATQIPSADVATPPDATGEAVAPASADRSPVPWLLALLAFTCGGWLSTWLVMRRRQTQSGAQSGNRQAGHTRRALANACRNGDAKAIRNAWIQHLGERWNTSPDATIAKLRQHPEGRRLLDTLNHSLYAPSPSERPDGQAILAFNRSLEKNAKPQRAQALPALHPH